MPPTARYSTPHLINVAARPGVSMVVVPARVSGRQPTPGKPGPGFRAAVFLKVCWDELASTLGDRMQMLFTPRLKSARASVPEAKSKAPAAAAQVQLLRPQLRPLRRLRQLRIQRSMVSGAQTIKAR